MLGAVFFENWTSKEEHLHLQQYVTGHTQIPPYVPGNFKERELPLLLTFIEGSQQKRKDLWEKVDTIIIDGYVDLGTDPGLGRHLYNALSKKYLVVGVAKKPYKKDNNAVPLCRGKSNTPVYVSSTGSNLEATKSVFIMDGKHRLPTFLKLADSIARNTHKHEKV